VENKTEHWAEQQGMAPQAQVSDGTGCRAPPSPARDVGAIVLAGFAALSREEQQSHLHTSTADLPLRATVEEEPNKPNKGI
jgi:hypothetical protein